MEPFFFKHEAAWTSKQILPNKNYVCGFCNMHVSSIAGYSLTAKTINGKVANQIGGLYICSNCGGPTFFAPAGNRYPAPSLGRPVSDVPEELNELYEEARRCSSQNCYTAAVLLCRKMLMNIAVQQGAEEGLRFIEYVNFLSERGFVPPNGRHWVDHIRSKGNEATHEIALMKEQDAYELIIFVEMLLKFIYEFPSMIPTPSP